MGHQGRNRTLSLVRQRFYRLGLEADVEQKECVHYIQLKAVAKHSAELVLSLWSWVYHWLSFYFIQISLRWKDLRQTKNTY